MNREQEFLNLYRKYESLLRDSGTSYTERENEAEDRLQNRMRICRQMRNYLTHQNDEGFLCVSELQIRFLEEQIYEQEMAGDVLVKHLLTIRVGSCKEIDTLESAYRKMKRSKSDCVAVGDGKRVWSVLTVSDVLEALLKGKTIIKDAKCTGVLKYYAPSVAMSDILQESGVICCSEDGTNKGKQLGVWIVGVHE